MLGWIVALGVGGYLANKYIKDGDAEKNSYQKRGGNKYSQYIPYSIMAIPDCERHVYVDGLLFCKTHKQYSPYEYRVNDIPVGCRLTVIHRYQSHDAVFLDIVAKPAPDVKVYTSKRGNKGFDRGLWVNEDTTFRIDELTNHI